jgi:hypothetical protein
VSIKNPVRQVCFYLGLCVKLSIELLSRDGFSLWALTEGLVVGHATTDEEYRSDRNVIQPQYGPRAFCALWESKHHASLYPGPLGQNMPRCVGPVMPLGPDIAVDKTCFQAIFLGIRFLFHYSKLYVVAIRRYIFPPKPHNIYLRTFRWMLWCTTLIIQNSF